MQRLRCQKNLPGQPDGKVVFFQSFRCCLGTREHHGNNTKERSVKVCLEKNAKHL